MSLFFLTKVLCKSLIYFCLLGCFSAHCWPERDVRSSETDWHDWTALHSDQKINDRKKDRRYKIEVVVSSVKVY